MSKIIDCSKEVDINEFQDCLGMFRAEWITGFNYTYEKYKIKLAEDISVITIADLIRCHEDISRGEDIDIISVVIYKDGHFKYIACY